MRGDPSFSGSFYHDYIFTHIVVPLISTYAHTSLTLAVVYGSGHSRFTHSISCPSRDNPNAIVRVSEYSKSTTSRNESIVSISLEEQGDLSLLCTETPDESSSASDASYSESFSEEEGDDSITPSSAPNHFQEMEASDRHIQLEQYCEGADSTQSDEGNGHSKLEEFEVLNSPSCTTGIESECVVPAKCDEVPVKGDEGDDAVDGVQVYDAKFQGIFTIPEEQQSEHVSADEEALQVYNVTFQGIFSITDLESAIECAPVEGETMDVAQDEHVPAEGEKTMDMAQDEHVPAEGEKTMDMAQDEHVPAEGEKTMDMAQDEHVPAEGEKTMDMAQDEHVPAEGEKTMDMAQDEHVPAEGEKTMDMAQDEHVPAEGEKTMDMSQDEHVPAEGEKTMNMAQDEHVPAEGEKTMDMSQDEHVPAEGETMDMSQDKHVPAEGEKTMDMAQDEHVPAEGEKGEKTMDMAQDEHVPAEGEKTMDMAQDEHVPAEGEKTMDMAQDEHVPAEGEKTMDMAQDEHVPAEGEKTMDMAQDEHVPAEGEKTMDMAQDEHVPAEGEKTMDMAQDKHVPAEGETMDMAQDEHVPVETMDVAQEDITVSPALGGGSVPVEIAREEVLASQGITPDHCDMQADRHSAVLEAGQSCSSKDSNIVTTSHDQPDGETSDAPPEEGLGSPQEAGNTINIYDVRFCGIVSYCADDDVTLKQDSATPIGNPP